MITELLNTITGIAGVLRFLDTQSSIGLCLREPHSTNVERKALDDNINIIIETSFDEALKKKSLISKRSYTLKPLGLAQR